MCTYMCTYMCAYMCTCMCTYMCAYMYTCMSSVHLMQLPGRLEGCDNVIATLDDGTRDVSNYVHVIQQLFIRAEETSIHKIMAER